MAIRYLQCVIAFYILLLGFSSFIIFTKVVTVEHASFTIMMMTVLLGICLIGVLFWIDKHLNVLHSMNRKEIK